jgi:hypothetical protein
LEVVTEGILVVAFVSGEAQKVARVPADDLHTVAADNGFQDWHSEYEFYSLGVEPLVHYRRSSLNAVSNNALIRERDYTQRWMAETSYSSVKRSLGDTVRAQAWYREFRKIILMFASSSSVSHYDRRALPLFNTAAESPTQSLLGRVLYAKVDTLVGLGVGSSLYSGREQRGTRRWSSDEWPGEVATRLWDGK